MLIKNWLTGLRFFVVVPAFGFIFSTAMAAPLPPVGDFVYKNTSSRIPRMSPGGKYLAVTVFAPVGDRPEPVPLITVYDLKDFRVAGTIRLPVNALPKNYSWVDDERLIVEPGEYQGSLNEPVSFGEFMSVKYDGSKQEYLFGLNMFAKSSKGARYGDDYASGVLVGYPAVRNGHVLIRSRLWSTQEPHTMLYDVDAASAHRRLVADIPNGSVYFTLDGKGDPVFATGFNAEGNDVLFRQENGKWLEKPFTFEPLHVFNRDRSVYGYETLGKNEAESFVSRDVVSDLSSPSTVLMRAQSGSIDDVEYGAGEQPEIIALGTRVGKPSLKYMNDSEDAALHRALSEKFAGKRVHFLSFSADGSKLLFEVYGDRDPGAVYFLSGENNKIEQLFRYSPEVGEDMLGERKPFEVKARDGVQLYGYLTYPKNFSNGPLPMIVLPHGGPASADGWHFDSAAHFLASRGYLVMQLNFRGSSGRGRYFEESSYRQFGGKVMDDLIDGVNSLVDQGIADKARICTFGASFGGYAALMLPIRAPGLFKCAVGYAGVYDLALIHDEHGTRTSRALQNHWKKAIGTDPVELATFSPAKRAAEVKVPVLLVHGDQDKVCPPEQAKVMKKALTAAGNEPEWMMVEDEAHGFYAEANQKKLFERLEAFFAKHLSASQKTTALTH